MKGSESLQEFYQRVPKLRQGVDGLNNSGAGHINVFSRDKCRLISPYMRRDFYKVTLIIGEGTIQYANKWIAIDRPALLFSNPLVPYAWEASSEEQKGWFALFSESFLLNGAQSTSLRESPLFRVGSDPVFFLNDGQLDEISRIFQRMEKEMQSDYQFKYDVVRSHLHLIIHEAMKYNPANSFERSYNSSERIASLFLELLERQFPVDFPNAPLEMKSAKDYAAHLSVHVNHLNRMVKKQTQKTTTEHIADRVLREALALLQHSDQSVSEIAYSLGFDNPAYFTNFFKGKVGASPNQVRETHA
ncbi:MAG TPA: AraC family transcriptional regulator [Muricauda sp.]|nr:helix-turn-helix transcriptional regulator [uncultured Allomuricauda sp.]MBC73522.1 AraC family transcriptional regulator [Allomuricauda sp.]HBU77137.1 AraC family transcriptional regulator [Allomuricauda sp.]|tara:strand:- start:5342 stop:6250 length:909 start_codon:yes stop_codon:yes gene_type:complete